MTRKLLLLNLALIAMLALLAWTLRERWVEGKARENKVLRARVPAPPPPAIPPKAAVAPLKAAAYAEVAEKVLFAQDRNPSVILPPPPPPPAPKAVPPFPVAHGVMVFGNVPPTILLSEKGKTEQQAYQAGGKIGEFTIVSIDNQQVVFEWEGKTFRKNISDLEDSAPLGDTEQVASNAQGGPAAPPQSTPPPQQQPEELYNGGQGPGKQLSDSYRACQSTDSMPSGAVVDGFKKVVSSNPMAPGRKICGWVASQ